MLCYCSVGSIMVDCTSLWAGGDGREGKGFCDLRGG